jgi:hypothetical protein
MGYYANSTESDFTIPAAKIAAALEAVREVGGEGATLSEAIGSITSFEDCTEDGGEFDLGHHADKFLSRTEEVLAALAPFAREGSYIRFAGEDDSLFGFRVAGGKLLDERGVVDWRVDQ